MKPPGCCAGRDNRRSGCAQEKASARLASTQLTRARPGRPSCGEITRSSHHERCFRTPRRLRRDGRAIAGGVRHLPGRCQAAQGARAGGGEPRWRWPTGGGRTWRASPTAARSGSSRSSPLWRTSAPIGKWPEYREFCDRLFFAVAPTFPTEVLPPDTGPHRRRPLRRRDRAPAPGAQARRRAAQGDDAAACARPRRCGCRA